MEPRLLLIDDDRELCGLMREFFETHQIQVEVVNDGRSGLARAQSGNHDLVLLDVMMPGLDGFAVLEVLRRTSAIPVLMLTARMEAESRIRGLETGADDYLPKPFEPLELLARVRAILRRVKPGAPVATLQIRGVALEPGSRRVTQDGEPVELTAIEFDILESLMRAAGRVVSRDDLSRRLYQRDATPFDRAMDVHVSHLRKKLKQGDERILTIRGAGYQFSRE